VADAALREKRIDRAEPDSGPPARAVQDRRLDVVLTIRREQRQHGDVPPERKRPHAARDERLQRTGNRRPAA